jgi:hypothetical protein
MMKSSLEFRAALQTSSTQPVSIDDALSPSLHPSWKTPSRGLTLFAGLGHLKKYAATPEAQVHKAFYDRQITKISGLHALLNGQVPDEAKQRFFSKSSALWDGIKVFIVETLPTSITEGPFIGGVRPGVDDFHVGAWIARIAFVSGAEKSDEGMSVLEKRFGPLPENVKAYWTAWIGRDSWVKAYPGYALH